MTNMIMLVVIGFSYYIYNWQFLTLVDSFCGSSRRTGMVWLTFGINYAIFTFCSFLQLHLIFNWTVFFLAMLLEIRIIYRLPAYVASFFSLSGVILGLALNVAFRCLFAIGMDQPLEVFDNNVLELGNLKRYPIFMGFMLAGLCFFLLRKAGMGQKCRVLLKDSASLRFLVRIMAVLYIYLILNLLTYYNGGNYMVMKLWGLKSAVFAVTGFYFAMAYSIRMGEVNQYIEKARRERAALVAEKEAEEQIRIVAYTDPLTGCHNRQYAEEILDTLWTSRTPFGIIFLDLNGLKWVNDYYGHVFGDNYILAVAHALERFISKEDMMFRYGGDEFLVILKSADRSQAVEIMDRVNGHLAQLCRDHGRDIFMSVSWGFADSAEKASLEALLHMADQRMYENKKAMHKGRLS